MKNSGGDTVGSRWTAATVVYTHILYFLLFTRGRIRRSNYIRERGLPYNWFVCADVRGIGWLHMHIIIIYYACLYVFNIIILYDIYFLKSFSALATLRVENIRRRAPPFVHNILYNVLYMYVNCNMYTSNNAIFIIIMRTRGRKSRGDTPCVVKSVVKKIKTVFNIIRV